MDARSYGSHPLLQPVSHQLQPPQGLRGPGILPSPALPPEITQKITSAVVDYYLRQFEWYLRQFEWLSSFNGAGQRAIVEFRAREYPGRSGVLEVTGVRALSRQVVDDVCKKLVDVQGFTDAAVKNVLLNRPGLSPTVFGTAVHMQVRDAVNGLKNPAFKSEISFVKSIEEDDGTKRSIRVDVYEKIGDKTVCVYDIKTGRSRLGPTRMLEIAATVAAKFKANRIIVTEVKPGDK